MEAQEEKEIVITKGEEGAIRFRKYGSIENYNCALIMKAIEEENLGGGEWVVTEKVHGANLCLLTSDGIEVHAARRNDLLNPTDQFFAGWYSIVEKYKEAVQKAYQFLKEKRETTNSDSEKNFELKTLYIYGEFFGGIYPGMENETPRGITHVQKGIFYYPNYEFYAFDIHDGRQYLDFDEALEIFKACGFFYAQPLFRGTFSECLEYKHEFPTTIPGLLGITQPVQWKTKPLFNNFAEGIVIKPISTKYFQTGSRVILKKKIDFWAESKVFHRPKNFEENQQPAEYPEEVKIVLDQVESYITRPRLMSVISKIGTVTQKDKNRLIGLLAKDTMEDFKKDQEAWQQYQALKKEEQKIITKKLSTLAGHEVVNYFVDVQEGLA